MQDIELLKLTQTICERMLKFEKLKMKIKEEKNLKHLFREDSKSIYHCSNLTLSIGFTHLHKCVMKTCKYPSLNDYIDEYLYLYPEEINKVNHLGWTALMLASRNSKIYSSEKTVQILLKHGANINITTKIGGFTALSLAAEHSKIDSSYNTVKILLDHGADISVKTISSNFSPLYLCIRGIYILSSLETVQLLIERGALEKENKIHLIIEKARALKDEKLLSWL